MDIVCTFKKYSMTIIILMNSLRIIFLVESSYLMTFLNSRFFDCFKISRISIVSTDMFHRVIHRMCFMERRQNGAL